MVQVLNNPQEENEPILAESLQDPTPDTKYVTEEAYRDLSRTMMADHIKSNDPKINLELMSSALRNRNVPVAKYHMEELTKQISKDNVLDVILEIGKWIHSCPLNFEPSAPPLAESDEDRHDNWMIGPLQHLRELCLQVIDKNADFTLKRKECETLHYKDLLEITSRDSLLVSSETVCYSTIIRWYDCECERNCLVQENSSPRTVLRELVYAVRYGLMSEKEFLCRTIDGHKGPDRMGLLNERETNDILEYIKQREKKKKNLKELPFKMSRKRDGKPQPSRNGCKWEKSIVNCLVCWSAIFD